ncbi:hypothetical protein JCM11641_003844 [Rhodosporidiobolus odoratus]
MLAASPDQQLAHPFSFPPASTSSTLPLATVDTRTARGRPSERTHRHAREVNEALELLQRLADQVDEPRRSGEDEQDNAKTERGQGIIANLESHGWTHQTTTSGVRIFHSFSQDPLAPVSRPPAAERTRSVHTSAGTSVLSPTLSVFGSGQVTPRGAGPASRGTRANEALPYFRGEGWIEGSWNVEDVAATIASIGARSVWDPRFDASRSFVVEHLDARDSLYHLNIRGSLVSDRDATVVTSCTADSRPDKANVIYVASTSVEDSLVPRSSTRTQITLNGFALRSLPRAPDFEQTLPEVPVPTSPPSRPAHRRTRSTASALHGSASGLLATVPLPPLPSVPGEGNPQRPAHAGGLSPTQPPPLLHTLSSTTATSHSLSPQSASYLSLPFHAPPPLPPPKRGSLAQPPPPGPGLAVSMVVRASPGYNLPQTVVNQLSVHLPLAIATIGRFLSTHGFAPHILRSPTVSVREECYDPSAGKYRVVFARTEEQPEQEQAIKIRFHGTAFSKGRLDLEIQHVEPSGWLIDYDVPPRGAEKERLRLDREDEELGGSGSGQWKTRISLSMKPGPEADNHTGRKGSAGSVFSPVEGDDSTSRHDPALLPGPTGGCTVSISLSAVQPLLPVIVTICRPSHDTAVLPLSRMRGMGDALAQAAQAAFDDNSSFCDSVEQLLECGREGDERAEMCLKGARLVINELAAAKEREAAKGRAGAAAAAMASTWGRRLSLASAAALGGGGSLRRKASRGGEPASLNSNGPFSMGSRWAPLSPTAHSPA